MYYVCDAVGQRKPSGETSGTSVPVSRTSPADSVADLAPVTAVSDVDLRTLASPTEFIDTNFAVS